MSIYSLAAELGKAIREDERMIRMEKAKEAYESSEKIGNLMMEYGIQQQALTTMGDGDEIDTDAVTRIQDRIDEIYAEITMDPIFKELDEAQAAVNELMETVNNTIMFNATGQTPCTHDCSSCSGCH
ncbi:MAG: YlbF family regulator [Ruminococcaceae bacterium]|nr:YlbF family regulator [Oscillospiraceae bacterium]